MIDLLALVVFIGFIALGLRARYRRARAARSHVVMFIASVLLFTNSVQIDLWPFTRFIPAVVRPNPESTTAKIEVVALDAGMAEHQVDMRVFSPVPRWIVEIWIVDLLEKGDQTAIMRDLLSIANEGRARLAEGKRIGPQRLLGPFAIPYWQLHGRSEAVTVAPWKGLRVYETSFVPVDYGSYLERRSVIDQKLLGEFIDRD